MRMTTGEAPTAEARDVIPMLTHFFEPHTSTPRAPRHWGLRHPWRDPPQDVVPADSGIAVVLARGRDVAVLVHEVEAWREGFQLTLRVRTRPGSDAENLVEDPIFTYEPYARRRWEHGHQVPPEQLRFGLQLSGGARVTNLSPGAPPGPFLAETRLPGIGGEWVYRYAVFPLPEEGDLWAVCEWPRLGIDIAGARLDAGAVRAAAEQAIRLW